MGESGPTAAYARRSDTPHSPALGQSSSRSRRSSPSTGPGLSSSTTSSSSSRYSPVEPPQAEATGSLPIGTRRSPMPDTRTRSRQRTRPSTPTHDDTPMTPTSPTPPPLAERIGYPLIAKEG